MSDNKAAPIQDNAQPTPPTGGNRVVHALIWFAIAAALIKFAGIDGLDEQREHMTWDRRQARIVHSEVARDAGLQGDIYELHLEFVVDFDNETRTYRKMHQSGSGSKSMRQLAESRYASGATIEVLINPADRAQVAFIKSHPYGPYLLGFAPATLCALLGLSVLLRRQA